MQKGSVRTLIGLTVKLLRTERRITRRQLAELAQVNRSAVGRLERGDANVGIDVLDNLARGFGMTTWELLRAVVHYAHTLKYL